MKTARIKNWMKQNGHDQADIASDLEVSRPLVNYTIHGRAKNRKVLQWLLDHGCPEGYLDFPKRKAA